MTRSTLHTGVVLMFAAAALAAGMRPAAAQGFGLYEQGACAMGRAGAGVASPCADGSAVFFNPAGLALTTGARVASIGFTGIAPRGNFTNTGTSAVSPLEDHTYFAPSGYAAAPLGKRAVLGVGVFAPYGLTVDWPTTSEGRFLSYRTSLQSVYIQPTVAFRLNDQVLVGGGLDITRTSLDFRKRIDLSTQLLCTSSGCVTTPFGTPLTFAVIGVPPGTDFADSDLSGSGVKLGGHVGVIVRPNDRFSIGARYMTRQSVGIDNGTLTITQVPTNFRLPVTLGPGLPAGTPIDPLLAPNFAAGQALSNQTASTTLPLPDQFVAGIAAHVSDPLMIFVDYQYTHWKLLDQLVIASQFLPTTTIVLNYQDAQGVRAGGEYKLRMATVRGGVDVHSAASPDESVTPLLPEGQRQEVAAGVSLPVGRVGSIDLAYMFIHQSDRNGRTVDAAVPTTALNNGQFHYNANLFGASFAVKF